VPVYKEATLQRGPPGWRVNTPFQSPGSLLMLPPMDDSSDSFMPPLPLDVLLHIKAAECWLALGLPSEANREVEGIQPVSRAHEQVQRVCEKIRAATRTVARMIE